MIIQPRLGAFTDFGPAFQNLALKTGAAGGSKWAEGAWNYLFMPPAASAAPQAPGISDTMKYALVALGALVVLAFALGDDSGGRVVLVK